MSDMIRTDQKVSVHPETGRIVVETINNEPSMAQQQYKDDCDINNIMKKYTNTGEFLHLTSKQGQYADLTNITDYQGMLDKIIYADEAFSSLPAEVRKRFDNNPAELLTFLQNSNNYDEGVKLGLIQKKPDTTPVTLQPQTPQQTPISTPVITSPAQT